MVGFISKRAAAEGRWTVILEQEGDDLLLPIPDDLLTEAGWEIGDTIVWKDNGDGSWQLINMNLLNDGSMNQKTGD